MYKVTVKKVPSTKETSLRFSQVTRGSFFYRTDVSSALGQKLDYSAVVWYYENGPEIHYAENPLDPDTPVRLASVHITWSKE
jgi:hypothetical protein